MLPSLSTLPVESTGTTTSKYVTSVTVGEFSRRINVATETLSQLVNTSLRTLKRAALLDVWLQEQQVEFIQQLDVLRSFGMSTDQVDAIIKQEKVWIQEQRTLMENIMAKFRTIQQLIAEFGSLLNYLTMAVVHAEAQSTDINSEDVDMYLTINAKLMTYKNGFDTTNVLITEFSNRLGPHRLQLSKIVSEWSSKQA